jgi:hypothetical protein
MYENLLLGDFATEIKKWLDGLQSKITGELDKQSFTTCSIAGSGKHAFVIKGFIKDGPAVRFRCPWGQLSDGEIFFMEPPEPHWADTSSDKIQFVPGTKAKVVLDFKDENDKKHHAEFHL